MRYLSHPHPLWVLFHPEVLVVQELLCLLYLLGALEGPSHHLSLVYLQQKAQDVL